MQRVGGIVWKSCSRIITSWRLDARLQQDSLQPQLLELVVRGENALLELGQLGLVARDLELPEVFQNLVVVGGASFGHAGRCMFIAMPRCALSTYYAGLEVKD